VVPVAQAFSQALTRPRCVHAGKMDPFLTLSLAGRVFRSKTHNGAARAFSCAGNAF